VLFYGQSIIQQQWWVTTATELRRAFPQANLIIENRAIGSFDATFLINTAEVDVYPFRPDLIIFHCYGPFSPGREWEQLLRQFRARTTAEVILVGNHPLRESELAEPTDPPLISFPSEAWLNYIFSEALVRELGFCFPDNRTAWKTYLRTKQVPLNSLLLDGVHLNLEGSELQFASLRPYLKTPNLLPAIDPFNNGKVTTWSVGTNGLNWEGGKLRLEFVGNRVDAIAGPGVGRLCRVRLDGKVPTSLPSGRAHRRTSKWTGEVYPWPALLKVGAQAPLILETWALRVAEVDPLNQANFRFVVSGSLTGNDGVGVSTNLFVSESGRVRIAPEDWLGRFPKGISQLGTFLLWQTEDRAVDDYFPFAVAGVPGEAVTTLINDLPDGPHVLELIADDSETPPPVVALRTYHPGGALWESAAAVPPPPVLQMLPWGDEVLLVWPEPLSEGRLMHRGVFGDSVAEAIQATGSAAGYRGVRWPAARDSGFFRLEYP